DLDFVLNNPSTIGNPGFVESPKVTANDPQIIPNAKWRDKKEVGACNYEPVNLEYDSVSNLGYIYAKAINGDSTCQTTLFWRDRVEYYSCEDILKNGGIYARIFRRWAAICGGARKDTVQVISFARPKIKDFVFNVNGEERWAEGFDKVVTYESCSPDKSLIQKEDVTPYVLSYFNAQKKFMDEFNAGYSIKLEDQNFPTCGDFEANRGVRVWRKLILFDSCQGNYVDTLQVLIKIGDHKGPQLVHPQLTPEISTDSLQCTASFLVSATALQNKFGIEFKECQPGFGVSATVKSKDRYVNGVLVAENTWDKVAYPVYNNKITEVPPGRHRLLLFMGDGCYNYAQDSFEFVVKDKSAPAPICVDGLTVELLPDGNGGGKFTLQATDFVKGRIFDCNGQGPDTLNGQKLITRYSVNRVGKKVDSSQTALQLTCDDRGVVLVELHAWDEKGNDGFCVTYAEVQDYQDLCPFIEISTPYITGSIATEGNENLQGVTLTLSGPSINTLSAVTTEKGGYSFVNLPRWDEYTVTPKLDKNPINGVSTFDLLLIQKHILNTQSLNSPYKMIAADVNNSKSISTIDMIQLRKLILNIDQRFQNNTSWRFVNAVYVFPDPKNPWSADFPETVYVQQLSNFISGNFVAIKIGDVNASAKVNTSE
ncbi:MAG TPA: dockerin type I domain-containing protein, partial [Haliscomenobacter sp.]|nr:dockerin type I domain-containing protein [Haliscomenobacter sp.]